MNTAMDIYYSPALDRLETCALRALEERGFSHFCTVDLLDTQDDLHIWTHDSVDGLFYFDWLVPFQDTRPNVFTVFGYWVNGSQLSNPMSKIFNAEGYGENSICNEIIDGAILPLLSEAQYTFHGRVLQGLESMPPEIIRMICKHISVLDVCSLSQSSKRMSEVCKDDGIWKHLFHRDFPMPAETLKDALQGRFKQGYKLITKGNHIFRNKLGMPSTCLF